MSSTVAPSTLVTTLGDGWRRPRGEAQGLADAIRALVVDGRLAVRTRIPSERALAPALGLSRGPARRAAADPAGRGARPRAGAGSGPRPPRIGRASGGGLPGRRARGGELAAASRRRRTRAAAEHVRDRPRARPDHRRASRAR